VVDEEELATATKKKLSDLEELVTAVGLETRSVELQGPPLEHILAQAESERVDLIVIGSHHHGAFYHLFEGGVTEGILRRARCPVLVVPQGDPITGSEL